MTWKAREAWRRGEESAEAWRASQAEEGAVQPARTQEV